METCIAFKDWLFVTVPEDANSHVDLMVKSSSFELRFIISKMDERLGVPKFYNKYVILPPGSYEIIGKGDAIDWEWIVEKYPSASDCYKDYGKQVFGDDVCLTATKSGHSLLRSLEMEPGTTLILKKNEK